MLIKAILVIIFIKISGAFLIGFGGFDKRSFASNSDPVRKF